MILETSIITKIFEGKREMTYIACVNEISAVYSKLSKVFRNFVHYTNFNYNI